MIVFHFPPNFVFAAYREQPKYLEEKVKTQNVATRNTREGKGAGQPGTQATKVINQETQVRKLFVGAGGF